MEKALGYKWVYKIKLKSDYTVEHYKARLVILGNNQITRDDFTETFALIANLVIVHTLLVVTATKEWDIYQMDVHNAFLHSDLAEEVYIPPNF